jgi:hypothetical protein
MIQGLDFKSLSTSPRAPPGERKGPEIEDLTVVPCFAFFRTFDPTPVSHEGRAFDDFGPKIQKGDDSEAGRLVKSDN